MRILACFLVAVSCSFSGTVLAESLSELLIPISPDELTQVEQSNEYFLKARLYFAKRHRIVRINETVLQSNEPFTISLFPDTQITVARESARIYPESVIHWKGKITSPEATAVLESTVGLSITGVAYDRDIASNRSYPSRSERNAQGFKRPDDSSLIAKSAFYSFATDISLPSNGDGYQIRALEASPEFHIVIEVDKSREFFVEVTTDRENEKRRDAYNSYMKTLGEDPRTRWALRHEESK